jgi:DNA-binding transcriptional LysR family regulator
MNITLARTFLEILNAGNLNRAAERLNVTQSTVTMRLNALEGLLGQRLLVRNKAGVELTNAGFKFQRYAEMLVQVWRQAQQDVALPRSFSATLTIGFEYDLWDGAIEEWVGWFRENLPDVALAIWAGEAEILNRWLPSNLVDTAVAFGTKLEGDLEMDKLFEDRLVLVSREERRLNRLDSDYIFVEWGEEFARAHALTYPVDEPAALTFGEGSFALRHLLNKGGFGYFPLRAVRRHLEDGRLHIVPEAPEFPLSVFLARSPLSFFEDWFDSAVEALRDIGRRYQDIPLDTSKPSQAPSPEQAKAALVWPVERPSLSRR